MQHLLTGTAQPAAETKDDIKRNVTDNNNNLSLFKKYNNIFLIPSPIFALYYPAKGWLFTPPPEHPLPHC